MDGSFMPHVNGDDLSLWDGLEDSLLLDPAHDC
jgi:hypothetical protein